MQSGNVFGPVPSRRLGRSLGVDLVPFKTCTYDCVYCQLGRTTCKTRERKEWVSLDDTIAEIREKLPLQPDYITLSGSGEPTLYSRMGDLIERIRSMTEIPVAVLTNGSLLWDKEVRSQLLEAQLVVPSLDAGDEAMFELINRTVSDITFEGMTGGLAEFRRDYRGELWLEVFILGGYTSLRDEAVKIAEFARKIAPDRVQLNTVTRPPAEDFAVRVSKDRMRAIASLFDPVAEVIADYRHASARDEFTASRDSVLQTIRRRPCSVADISSGLCIHMHEAIKHIEELLARGLIEKTTSGETVYYRCPGD